MEVIFYLRNISCKISKSLKKKVNQYLLYKPKPKKKIIVKELSENLFSLKKFVIVYDL